MGLDQVVVKHFDIIIVKAPEGLMGLTKDKKPIPLNHMDMVSAKILDDKFTRLAYLRGLIMPVKMVENFKDIKVKRIFNKPEISRKKRAKGNKTLEKWLGVW